MAKATLYFAGLPTKPDVDRLRERFGVPEEGARISHDDLEQILASSRKSSRYRTIIHAWRSAIYREHNVFLGADRGRGFVALSPDDRAERGAWDFRVGIRKCGRAAALAIRTDKTRCTEDNRKVLELIERQATAVRLAIATEAKPAPLPPLERKK